MTKTPNQGFCFEQRAWPLDTKPGIIFHVIRRKVWYTTIY